MSTFLELKKYLETALKSEAEANLILFSLLKESAGLNNFSDLYRNNIEISDETLNSAEIILKKRLTGTPLQHLLNNQFFFNHDYIVNKDVLIPRPETEILLEEIFKTISIPNRFAELGLGSGIISCELLSHYAELTGVASELSPASLTVAEKNLTHIVGSDWNNRLKIIQPKNSLEGFESFKNEAPFDLIVSNPPYVSSNDEIEDQVKNNEPHLALFPPISPNYFYENFLQHAAELLSPNGIAFFEIPHERASELFNLFNSYSQLSSRIVNDLTGRPRVLIAKIS